MVAETLPPEAPEGGRPDVLGYPSPTTSRYLIFVAALLASGLFVGNYVHTMVWGDAWQETVAVCLNRTSGLETTSTDLVTSSRAFSACTADVERTRAAVTALGAVAVAAAALALMWLAPVVVVRRRRLRPFPPALGGAAERFATLAGAAGVTARVVPVLGATDQRDGFTFGAPGHYRVALPPAAAVRWRDPAVFDPLVAHELAHVRHRDVPLAWLTRLVWWALAPLLALPVLVGIVVQDYSILGSYVWRVGLLVVVVALLSSQLLRTREHDADLRAAQLLHGPDAVLGLVRRLHPRTGSALGRLVAKHPDPPTRVAALESPTLVTRTGLLDGLTGGFLSAAALPLLVAALTPALAGSGQVVVGYLLAAALLGPMLAGSVGLGVWRAILYAVLEDRPVSTTGVAVGTGVGLVLGQAVSLQQAGIGTLTGVDAPGWLLVTGLAGGGAVLVSGGLGHLWADAAPRIPRARPAWLVALVVNSLLFSTVLWACSVFQSAVDLGGWSLGREALMSTLSPWWAVAVVGILAVATATAMGLRPGGRPAPRWLVEGAAAAWPEAPSLTVRTLLVGALAGSAAATTVVAYRVAAGPAASDQATLQRFLAYQWAAALGAAAVLVALVLAARRRGAGAALLGAPVAVLCALLGFMTLNTALGGPVDGRLAAEFLRPATVMGFYACLLTAPVATLVASAVRRRAPDPAPSPRPIPLLALALCLPLALAGGAAAVAGRDVLVGPADPTGLLTVADPTAEERPEALRTELVTYESETVPQVLDTYARAAAQAQQVLADPSLDDTTRAASMEALVVAPLSDLSQQLGEVALGDERLVAAHQEAQLGVEAAITRFLLWGDAGPTPDQATLAELGALQEQEAQHWQRWSDQRRALLDEVLGSS